MVRISALRRAALPLLLPLLLGACGQNNIGRLFAPRPGGGPGGTTGVQAVEERGSPRDGRPRVEAVFPTGNGWPGTVPIVVVFNESINSDLAVPQNEDPLVYVRVTGTEQPLPASYDFLLGSTVVLIRPLAALSGAAGVSHEIVVDPNLRDIDAVRFGGSAPRVLGTFFADQDPAIDDGRILTTLPLNNEQEATRETDVFAVFTKPADPASVTGTNFRVAVAAGADANGTRTFPLSLPGVGSDGRLLRFRPNSPLSGTTDYEIFFDSTITFGNGVLDFLNRTPFSRFRTLAFEAVVNVTVGNPVMGFPDKVNTSNLDTLMIDVEVPASAAAGDTVLVRIYGLDPQTTPADDVNFVAVSASLTVAGNQTVTLDFTGELGTLAAPRFSDGALTIGAQLRRGARHAGFVLSGNDPAFDATLPELVEVGPPMSGAGDIITDLESLAFYGTASEELGAASLTTGGPAVGLFAAAADGRFVLEPLLLGRLTAPVGYSLNITDAAGNMAAMALAGSIRQRGAVTAPRANPTDDVVVEVYDEATLQVIPGATVVLDPGVPQVPAAGQIERVTGADGRFTFTAADLGAGSNRYTVTAIRAGYHLRTLYDTDAGFVSLPLRAMAGATATLSGTALFPAAPGTSALIGSNVLDDVLTEEIATTTVAPSAIPGTSIRPGRPQVITGFAGIIEPTTTPTFAFYTCQLCGLDGLTPTAPVAPAGVGENVDQTIALVPEGGVLRSLMAAYAVDFSVSAGLGAVAGTPTARVVTGLQGFSGQTLMGVGFASGAGPHMVDASFAQLPLVTLAAYVPVSFVSTEAADGAGNVSRVRALLDPVMATADASLPPPGIPTIAVPGGPFADAPLVDYTDRLDRTAVPGAFGTGFGLSEFTATDPAGRGWSLWVEDDGSTSPPGASVQFPDLTGIAVPGLSTGNWSIRAEDFLFTSASFGLGDFLPEERFRRQVAYARAAAVGFVVN